MPGNPSQFGVPDLDSFSFNMTQVTLAASGASGSQQRVNLGCDFLFFDTITASPILLSVNGRTNVYVRPGATLQGSPKRGEISFVLLSNPTASAVSVILIWGTGTFQNTGQVAITNPDFTIDAATQTELAAAIVAAEKTAGVTYNLLVWNVGGVKSTYNDPRNYSMTVLNTSTVVINVQGAAINPGEQFTIQAPSKWDGLGSVLVDTSVNMGGTATVVILQHP